jgi:ADP-ribose pyrophosphatase YjhB (NUDIX family)
MNSIDFEIKKDALVNNIKANIKKYGKNFPWKAWLPENVSEIPFTEDDTNGENKWVCTGKPKTVFSGRFCAVSGFIYAIVNGKYSILANLRGEGTPDYQGCWNAPCGFLECFENSKEGIQRELFEECGFIVDTDDLNVIYVETEPEECNNGNVSIRHYAFLGKIIPHYDKKEGGEENEVDSVKWIPVKDIDKYKWAFNHIKTTKLYAPVWWKRIIIELYYKWFKNYNDKYTDVLQEIQAELKK